MALLIEDKKQIVAEVTEVASTAFAAVVADYQGLTVEQLTALRVEARKLGVATRVVRNTLAKRALQDTQFSILNDNLVGPTILAFSTSEDDMGAAARLFEEFAKTNKAFELKAAAFDGKLYQGEEVSIIANLPNHEKALTMLASVLQDVANAVKNAKSGQARYRVDKGGIIHAAIGQLGFSEEAVRQNVETLIADLKRLKPATSKGVYVKKITLSSTMGPGLIVDVNNVSK